MIVPSGWLVLAARVGYTAKGLVYVTMGALAIGVAMGLADRAAGSRRVLELFVALPFGRALALALAAGLFGYAALSFVAAVQDPERNGRDLAGLYTRAIDAFTGAVYLGLAFIGLRLVAEPGYRGGTFAEQWMERALTTTWGAWLAALVGTALLVTGLSLVWRAGAGRFGRRVSRRFDRRLLDRDARRWLARLARLGSAARGVAFGYCGALLLGAARRGDGDVVRGLGDALSDLGALRFGPPLLALVGLGFVAYGAYQLAKVRFRRYQLP